MYCWWWQKRRHTVLWHLPCQLRICPHKRSIEPLIPTRSATINNATDPHKLCWLDCSQLATGCNMEPTQTTPLTTLHCQIHTFSSRHYLRTETLSWDITGQIISHLSNWKRSGDLQSILHCFACVMLAETAPIALWCWPYNGFNYLIFCETLNEWMVRLIVSIGRAQFYWFVWKRTICHIKFFWPAAKPLVRIFACFCLFVSTAHIF
jgi:hypothetical protein